MALNFDYNVEPDILTANRGRSGAAFDPYGLNRSVPIGNLGGGPIIQTQPDPTIGTPPLLNRNAGGGSGPYGWNLGPLGGDIGDQSPTGTGPTTQYPTDWRNTGPSQQPWVPHAQAVQNPGGGSVPDTGGSPGMSGEGGKGGGGQSGGGAKGRPESLG